VKKNTPVYRLPSLKRKNLKEERHVQVLVADEFQIQDIEGPRRVQRVCPEGVTQRNACAAVEVEAASARQIWKVY